ncbi:TPA: hypothetical protein DEP30_02430 [Candidatus Nomurabacteria bacterium]|nr:MAG: hypothetical protein UR97_C0003G0006 [Candidatus Nomurabacteria bacterium GW2011_GWE2_36_115]KKP94126.1 MAG: hypothetical protein US00_C0003G0050 [Candidatus Nomurabacteria bacterium GW2011_GWF2_36_126]KKP96746.1 MAG: hypothetical protein US04_C0001G0248 [Candidatus Nomurabacteria bacterium GW2011_GWD2_36_14]KKP99650.1 MAG: hypothetical protein US08_C0001G0333 [Candidatus Nomurabacteria bacterium GW2011_GWF2_36_19]KKQ05434.1 MAG: hypothetical protein US17_C0004G0006 [Candidatus Nomuraba
MNKKFLGFIFAFIFVLLSAISFSHIVDSAGVVMTYSDLTSNSVTIKVSGIPPSTVTKVNIIPDKGYTTDHKQLTADLITDEKGGGEASFSGLDAGVNYKAKVKIDNLSYEIGFSTPKVPLNFSALNGMISEANNAYDKAVEGYSAGEYAQGSKARLSDAIKDAKHVAGAPADINYIQSDIDNATRSLKNALNVFELSKIVPPTPSNTPEDPVITDMKSNGIVPKCNTGDIDKVTGQYKVPCDFTFFMKLINNAIKFLLFVIATPLMALILMYTGYLYLTAGGKSGQVEKVKHILLNAVVGYVIALSAWLIISTIVSNVKLDSTINTFLTPMNQK